MSHSIRCGHIVGGLALLGLVGVALLPSLAQEPRSPVQVKIEAAEQIEAVEDQALPVDPKQRVFWQYTGNMAFGLTVDDDQKMLCCGAGAIRTIISIDNQILFPANPGSQQLPPGPRNKRRLGYQTTAIRQNVHITQMVEAIPSKLTKGGLGQKRRLDTALIRYVLENKDNVAHNVGVRVRIDAYCVDNDGALFASPTTHPKQILNGLELKGKQVPGYLQILQRPNVDNPGFVGHFTFKLGSKLQGPDRVALTAHFAGENGWNVQVVKAQGDSDAVIYFDPQLLKPGEKREVGYAYGQGIASENESRVQLSFGGSFAPGKQFTIAAYVDNPHEGQSLSLELPPEMVRLEGNETQPVPPPGEDGQSLVVWKARVLKIGTMVLKVRSSSGVTQTRTITITPGQVQQGMVPEPQRNLVARRERATN